MFSIEKLDDYFNLFNTLEVILIISVQITLNIKREEN